MDLHIGARSSYTPPQSSFTAITGRPGAVAASYRNPFLADVQHRGSAATYTDKSLQGLVWPQLGPTKREYQSLVCASHGAFCIGAVLIARACNGKYDNRDRHE